VLKQIGRPLGIAPPSNAPSQATLERRYGREDDELDTESYGSIRFSLMNMGDFGRYVVESGISHFSRHRVGHTIPNNEPARPRLIKSRWKSFVRSLDADQEAMLAAVLSNSEPTVPELLRTGFIRTLTEEQHELYSASWHRPKSPVRDTDYPEDRARRWVFQRTISLGWRPELFGVEDRLIGHGRGREGHKAERWGKKYQWMAYHELLARVADNFQTSQRHDERAYGGLHEIMAGRELDPSLPPVPYREFEESGGESSTSWVPSPVTFQEWPPARVTFSHYHGDIARFIGDHASESTLDRVAILTDTFGDSWVVLDAFLQQKDPEADRWYGLGQAVAIHSWLVPAVDGAGLLPHLARPRMWSSPLFDRYGHTDCCFYGEIGWTPRFCYHKHDEMSRIEIDTNVWMIVPAVETYMWEGSLYDCSIEESATAAAPSTFIRRRGGMVWAQDGPSWRDSSGEVIFTQVGTGPHKSMAFMVRTTWLSEFLADHELALLVSSWCERRRLDRDERSKHRWEESYSAAMIDASLNVDLSETFRRSAAEAAQGCGETSSSP